MEVGTQKNVFTAVKSIDIGEIYDIVISVKL